MFNSFIKNYSDFYTRLLIIFKLLIVLTSLILVSQKELKAGILDKTFLPKFNVPAYVKVVARQSDGKIIVAGQFNNLNSTLVNNISRINSDGTVDLSFNTGTGANAIIHSLLVQSDGKIIVGGEFTKFNGQERKYIVRLNPDGSVDSNFNVSPGFVYVYSLVQQSDGKILVGGNFSKLIVRLNIDGSIDNSFTSNTGFYSGIVSTIAIQSDKKILIGGLFEYNNNPPSNFVRLNQDGTVDSSFNLGNGLNSGVSGCVIQPDGKIVIVGSFTLVNNAHRDYIARLNSDGSVDETFTTLSDGGGFDNTILQVLLQEDGKIVVGGMFQNFGIGDNNFRRRIARLNPNGSLDQSFAPGTGFDNLVTDLIFDGNDIIAVGRFTSFNSINKFNIARLDSQGNLDSNFNPSAGFDSEIRVIKQLKNGKMLVGGNFDMVNGIPRTRIALLNSDGSFDTSFASSTVFSGNLTAIDTQPDGKILVGGEHFRVNGISKPLVRLNTDGSLDNGFNPDILGESVVKVKTLNDGKILIGGRFSNVDSTIIYNFARLDPSGKLDSSFNIGRGFNAYVLDFEVQSDGKIIVIGGFTTVNDIPRINIVRLNSNGAIDNSFNVDSRGIYDILIQTDGKIIIGGSFTSVNGVTRIAVARLNSDSSLDTTFNSPFSSGGVGTMILRPNGKLVVAGFFRLSATGIEKTISQLNENGSENNSVNPNIGGTVLSLDNQFDGRILIGGRINIPRSSFSEGFYLSFARIIPQEVKSDFDGDGKTDISIFRPSNGLWAIRSSSNISYNIQQFGLGDDQITPADFDGDGKTDIAVFRSSNGTWYLQQSSNGFTGIQFGASGDIPVPADYDGDGKSDIAVYRPATGGWYRLNSSNGQFVAVIFGASEDKPTIGDFDGDGKADIAVYRPSTGDWFRLNSLDNQFVAVKFGVAEDKPTPADFDADGKTDIAVFRPSTGGWYRLNSSNGEFVAVSFGVAEDKPVAADYDGDRKADIAVFRPSAGYWYLLRSTAGFTAVQFGVGEDKPVPNAFVK